MLQKNSINIRPAMPDDAAMLLELFYQHAEFEQATQPTISINKLAAIISDGIKIQLWVAAENKVLLGYFSITQDYSTWSGEKYLHLDCLFLQQNYRELGIGGLLFKKVGDIAKARGIQQVQWQTPIENQAGIEFYTHQGASYKIKSRFTLNLT